MVFKSIPLKFGCILNSLLGGATDQECPQLRLGELYVAAVSLVKVPCSESCYHTHFFFHFVSLPNVN